MLHGKRAVAALLLHRLGVVPLTLALRRRLPPRTLTVVNYHRVNDSEAAGEFDEVTLDATPEGFERQVRLLRREFTLLGPDDLGEHLRGRPWPPNPALLTFDDGYRDNYERALPILQRHGAKAFFFIATDFVTHRRLFWWDRISYTLKHARRSSFSIAYPHPRRIDLTSGVHGTATELHRLVKETFDLDVGRFLSELAEAAEVVWNDELERQLADKLIMNWDQVRALRSAGMGIGSHTRRHRVLRTLPLAELSNELGGSRADLEAMLGEPVAAIAYPGGSRVPHPPDIRRAVESAGYELGFAYGRGTSTLSRLDPLDIKRLPVERDWSEARFRAAITFSFLA